MTKITDRLWDIAARERFPMTAAFELLPVCNFNCKMCYVRKDMAYVNANGGLIPGARWLEIAREMRDMGLLFPLLTGGEPLLHPDFREIYLGLKEMGMQISINSNASLIDEDMARFLGQNPPSRINITLYGAGKESYEALCGNGEAFTAVHKAVGLLKENGVSYKFNTTITAYNAHELKEIVAFAKEMEAPIQIASYVFPPIRRDEALVGRNDRLSPQEAARVKVLGDYLQNEPRWFLAQAYAYSHFTPLDQLPQPMLEGALGIHCRAGRCSAWLDWQGNMGNCGMYSAVKRPIGSRPVREVWDEIKEENQRFHAMSPCASCPNQPLCHPCVAMVNNECGPGGGRPDYLCRMNEAAARLYLEYVREYYPEEMKAWRQSGPARSLTADPCGMDKL